MRVERRDALVLEKVHLEVQARMAAAGAVTQTEMRSVLSGPAGSAPGQPPGMVSGGLESSIDLRMLPGEQPGFRVEPRDPEHRKVLSRLERGFVGTDAAGRTWHQQPRPVVSVVLVRSSPAIRRALGAK